jgi:branched-chain amino acid transport system permease protein
LKENYRKERIARGIKARSDDIYALTSYKEMWYLLFPRLVPIVGIAIIAYFLPLYWKKVVITTCIFAMLSVSWDFLSSCGLLSLGQALFFGIGSYTAGSLNHYLHLPIYVTIPVATVVGGFISTMILLPVIRLRGIYFAMVTLILPLMLMRLVEATKMLGGTEGLTGLSPFPNTWVEITFILAAMWAALFGLRRLIASDYGLIFVSIRDNDRATMASGINIYGVFDPADSRIGYRGDRNPRRSSYGGLYSGPSFGTAERVRYAANRFLRSDSGYLCSCIA